MSALKIDWQRVVLNLKSAGISYTMTARKVGMAPETLSHYARGECEEPKFSKGIALLDLHLAVCPEKHKLEDLKK